MPISYNPFDWYWSVQDTLPGSQVWASARNQYVALADATYVAWLAAGNLATVIDTQANLGRVFDDVMRSVNRGSLTIVTSSSVQMTHPISTYLEIESSDGKLFAPFVFSPTGWPRSFPLYVKNTSASVVLTIYAFDQTTVLGTLAVGEVGFLFPTRINDTTGVGIWSFFHLPVTNPADAANLTSGLVALARGGVHVDLSATGGTSKFLRQNSSGADITVVQPASTDLSDTTAPGAYAPTDQSGAALTLTTNVQYTKIGNLVYMYGLVTYPVTANGTANKISLPVAVPAGTYAIVPGMATSAVGAIELVAINGTSNAAFFNFATAAQYTNVQLSAATIRFMLIYPIT